MGSLVHNIKQIFCFNKMAVQGSFIDLLQSYPEIKYGREFIHFLGKESVSGLLERQHELALRDIELHYPDADRDFLNQLKFINRTQMLREGFKFTVYRFETLITLKENEKSKQTGEPKIRDWLVLIKFVIPLKFLELLDDYGIFIYVFKADGSGITYEELPNPAPFVEFFAERGLPIGFPNDSQYGGLSMERFPIFEHTEYNQNLRSDQETAQNLIKFLKQVSKFPDREKLIQALIDRFDLTDAGPSDQNVHFQTIKRDLLNKYDIDPIILENMSFILRYQHPSSKTPGLVFRADFKISGQYHQTLIVFNEGTSYSCKITIDIFNETGDSFDLYEIRRIRFIEEKLLSYLTAYGFPINEQCVVASTNDNHIDEIIERYRDMEIFVR